MQSLLFPALCQQQVCEHLSPAKPRLLAALSLLLIPVLGFILHPSIQPRWFQGVSCLLVNPCPALSCRNLPKQPGCGGNLWWEVPGCSLLPALGQDQGHLLVLVARWCSLIVLPAPSQRCSCILSGVSSEVVSKKKNPSERKGFC